MLPLVLHGKNHDEVLKELPAREQARDYSKVLAHLYFLMAYGLGGFIVFLPDIYQSKIRG